MAAELQLDAGEPALLPHLLLVDDGTQANGLLELELLNAGYLVTTAEDAAHALELLLEVHPDLIVRGADVLQTTGCRLRRVTSEKPNSAPPPLPETQSATAAPRLDLDSVIEEVERLVRTSLLPPAFPETTAEEVA